LLRKRWVRHIEGGNRIHIPYVNHDYAPMSFLLNLVVALSRMDGSASPSWDSHANMVLRNFLVICLLWSGTTGERARSLQKGFGVKTQPAFWSADQEFGVSGPNSTFSFGSFSSSDLRLLRCPLLHFSQSLPGTLDKHGLEWPRSSLGNRQSTVFAAVPCLLGEGNTTS
jgi:hypothetical protein